MSQMSISSSNKRSSPSQMCLDQIMLHLVTARLKISVIAPLFLECAVLNQVELIILMILMLPSW